MLTQISPRLGRSDVMSNSFSGCVSNTSKEFSRTPEIPFLKILSEPRMLLQKTKSAVTFKQLQSFADTHSDRHLNKQVDVVNSDVEFINFETFSISNLPGEELTIHPNPIEFHGVHSILAFPHEVKSVLPEGMISAFQIHFSSPEHSSNYIRNLILGGLESSPSDSNHSEILNFEGGNSSLGLKAEVPCH